MRFLFCSFASPGFLFPLVGLAHELRRRGHETAFATGLGAVPVLAGEALPRIPRGDRDGDSFNPSLWYDPLSCALDVKHVEYAIARYHPDALVTHHLCLSALVAGERAGIPAAVLGSFTYLWPAARPAEVAVCSETVSRREWRLDEGTRALNEVRRLFRLDPMGAAPEENGFLGDLFMLRSVPLLERDWTALPDRVHLVGPCTWEPATGDGSPAAAGAAWRDLEAHLALPDAPIVYLNNGRSFGGPSFWPQFVEGLADAPVQVVGSSGRMDAELGPLPGNFLIRTHIPHGLVMGRARAMAGSSHTAAVLGALMHGLPSVLFPYGVDTLDNAERLVDAGCALAMDVPALTPGAARDAVERVLADAPMRRNCAAACEALRAAHSFAPAAGLVEELALGRAAGEAGFGTVALAGTATQRPRPGRPAAAERVPATR
ncbi:MAG TPA: nucleotide disphospho-sugar-binding domain-containing protein [Longimicrobium sp.]|jgi:UDP:flavonoid glycosyltransferase YjiC (YdhE family)